MNKILDDLVYLVTGEREEEEDEGSEDVAESDDACEFCGGTGLPDSFCPACGSWDIRSEDEIEDAIDDTLFI